MFKSRFFLLPTLLLGGLFMAGACDSGSDKPTDHFDREAMLRRYATELIAPSFDRLLTQAEALRTAVAAFNDDPTAATLDALQLSWTAAYTGWQSANAWNFGPAGEEGLRKGLIEEIGTFPANKTRIEEFVTTGQWELEGSNRDARGLPAMEYLIFGESDDPAVLAAFSASGQRRALLSALADNVRDRASAVASAWNGVYRDGFVQNNGTDVGSSTSQLYNEFVRSFESVKNFKVGLPAGKRPGQTQPEPALCEAYYSGQSLEMLRQHLAALERLYYGRNADGQEGTGFDDYLRSVVGGPELIAATEAQWQNVEIALAAVPTDRPLSQLMAEEHPAIDALHTELQKHTRFFKSDLSSLLGIAITFSSGDGD